MVCWIIFPQKTGIVIPISWVPIKQVFLIPLTSSRWLQQVIQAPKKPLLKDLAPQIPKSQYHEDDTFGYGLSHPNAWAPSFSAVSRDSELLVRARATQTKPLERVFFWTAANKDLMGLLIFCSYKLVYDSVHCRVDEEDITNSLVNKVLTPNYTVFGGSHVACVCVYMFVCVHLCIYTYKHCWIILFCCLLIFAQCLYVYLVLYWLSVVLVYLVVYLFGEFTDWIFTVHWGIFFFKWRRSWRCHPVGGWSSTPGLPSGKQT